MELIKYLVVFAILGITVITETSGAAMPGYAQAVCSRRPNWCAESAIGGKGDYFLQDCDCDGIPDPCCSAENGRFWFISSWGECKHQGGDAGNAACKICH